MLWELVCQAANPVFEQWDVKVDEETEVFVAEFEIGEELGGVDLLKFLYGFEFDDDFVLNEEVDSVGVFNNEFFEPNWK